MDAPAKRMRAASSADNATLSEAGPRASPLATSKPARIQGYVVTDHVLQVPLDHFSDKDGPTIQLFAREVVATNKVLTSQPYLCFFQGGPGFESPVPSEGTAWLSSAVKHFRVILLDQRGTGRSTPIRASTLKAVGSVDAQVKYLRFFRADSIVADAELLRQALLTPKGDKKRWCALGQSFGGFCLTHYLATAPEGLLEVFLTGGIPPKIDDACPADAVYTATFRRVMVQNDKYYSRFPQDVQLVKDIVNFLSEQPEGGVQTPSGNMLRPRTLQLLGMSALGGGGAGGGFERLHFLLSSALDYSQGKPELTPRFLKDVDAWLPFDVNPLYAVLHESIYTQGPATRWSAQRVREQQYGKVFDAEAAAGSSTASVFFTGEMVFPWMFEDLAALRPLKKVANAVAEADGWGKLYDSKALAANCVPVASATYCEDMYVDFNLAQETAAKVAGMRQWMTNEFQHSGLRDDGATIFETLLSMTRGSRVLF